MPLSNGSISGYRLRMSTIPSADPWMLTRAADGRVFDATQRDPIALLQVLLGDDVDEARCDQPCAHRGALVPSVLQQQPAARHQVRGRTRGNRTDGIQSVVARQQGRRR